MFRTFRLLVLTAGLSALTVTPGHAVPIVDQSFTSPSNLATVINECCRFIGQTFTAGLTGTLTGVNIDVGPARSDSVLPLLVAIRTVTGSFPSSTVLSSTTLARGGATLSELIVFPQAIHLLAGEEYAIVVNYERAPEPGPGRAQGSWGGSIGNVYPRGALFASVLDGISWFSFDERFDAHFQTLVDVTQASQPSALHLVGSGLIGLGVFASMRRTIGPREP